MKKILLLIYGGLILSAMISYFVGYKDLSIINLLMALIIKLDIKDDK